jgi:hypothetical protein
MATGKFPETRSASFLSHEAIAKEASARFPGFRLAPSQFSKAHEITGLHKNLNIE